MKRILSTMLLIAGSLVGCGGEEEGKNGRLPVFPVSGVVKYKGKPVTSADVTFFCTEKDKSGFGRTDDEGRFQLTTYAANDGVVAGKHVVTVVKITPNAAPAATAIEPEDPRYDPFAVEKAAIRQPIRNEIPSKYSDSKTSDLIVVVNDDGSNVEMTLELKD